MYRAPPTPPLALLHHQEGAGPPDDPKLALFPPIWEHERHERGAATSGARPSRPVHRLLHCKNELESRPLPKAEER